MKASQSEIISNSEIVPGLCLMWLDAPEIAASASPGQFLMVRCGEGIDPLLRRPLSIHRISRPSGRRRTSEGQIALLYNTWGPGTAILARKSPGERLDVIGPLGVGFSVDKKARNLLLVGAGWGISPIVALADLESRKERSVVMLIGAPTESAIYPLSMLPAEAEVQVATEDGSMGRKGYVTELLEEHWEWADAVYASGPMAMYGTIDQVARSYGFRKEVQVLADVGMACGTGVCYGCAVRTRRGMRLACKDGPRFRLRDLVL